MPRYLINVLCKAHGHDDWTFSKVVEAESVEIGDALDEMDVDEGKMPEAMDRESVWYFKLEVVKQQ